MSAGGARSHWHTITRASSVVGLVWMGDALIYVVLPVHASAFGLGLPWVGLILSVNRIVRIVGYGWIGPATRTLGAPAMIVAAATAGALSTVAYGVVRGVVPLLVARLFWGLSWAVLNVLTTAYSLGDGRQAGQRVGISRAVSTLSPTVALSAGAFLAVAIGPRDVFLVLGAIGLVAIPIALRLPPLAEVATQSGDRRNRWRPSSLNVLFFTITLAADGVFAATLSLLLAGVIPVTSALIGAGLLLALLRLATAVLSLAGGPIVDRIGPRRVLPASVIGIVVGLLGMAAGYLYAAATLLVLARAVLATVGPLLVAEDRRGSTVERLAAFATWVDCGLAAGPLLAGLLFDRIGPSALYAGLAVLLAAALAAHMVSACARRPAAA